MEPTKTSSAYNRLPEEVAYPAQQPPPQYHDQPNPVPQYQDQPQFTPQYAPAQPQMMATAPPPQMMAHPQMMAQPQMQHSHQANTTVVVAPTTQTMTMTLNVPDDNMGLAIFATICCFWPVGIFAILKARDVHKRAWQGDMEGSIQASRSARQLSLIALGIGIGSIILSIIIMAVAISNAAAAARSPYP